jgi:hypothetical protein|tara:strand:- start:483 stop:653 length:171 start_codon:yes stop_codon:yes gene_type:complete
LILSFEIFLLAISILGFELSHAKTWTPFLFKAFEVAHPIPEAPPVTIAIRLFLEML